MSGFIIWLYGLPGSGKTTLADGIQYRLNTQRGFPVKRLSQDQLIGTANHPTLKTTSEWGHLALTLLAIAEQEALDGSIVVVECMVPFSSLRQTETPHLEVFLDCHLGMCSGRERQGGYLNQSLRKTDVDLKVLIPWVDVDFDHDPVFSLDTDTDTAMDCLEELGAAFREAADAAGYVPPLPQSDQAIAPEMLRAIRAWVYWFPPGRPPREVPDDTPHQIAACSHPAPTDAPCCRYCAITQVSKLIALCDCVDNLR